MAQVHFQFIVIQLTLSCYADRNRRASLQSLKAIKESMTIATLRAMSQLNKIMKHCQRQMTDALSTY